MIVSHEAVYFKPAECSDLCVVLSLYTPQLYGGSTATENMAVQELWKKAGAINIASITTSILGSVIDDQQELRNAVAGKHERLLAGPYLEEVLDVVLGKKDLAYTGDKQQLQQAFLWAATNFVQGSVVMQNVVGSTLNSSFEDLPISTMVGSSNASLANTKAAAIINAGTQATVWQAQLHGAN